MEDVRWDVGRPWAELPNFQPCPSLVVSPFTALLLGIRQHLESQPVEHVKGDRLKLWSVGPAPRPPVSSPGFMALMTARQLRSTAS